MALNISKHWKKMYKDWVWFSGYTYQYCPNGPSLKSGFVRIKEAAHFPVNKSSMDVIISGFTVLCFCFVRNLSCRGALLIVRLLVYYYSFINICLPIAYSVHFIC